jgi:hexosaminidase
MAGAKADSLFTYFRIAVPATVQAPAFGITYRGYIDVPADGTYSFYLTCDDGGVLQIESAVTVDNDGNHSARVRSGQAILQKGLHPFKLDFIEGGGGFTLRLCYCFNGSPLGEIPDEWFRH